jgi:hypothetical protein
VTVVHSWYGKQQATTEKAKQHQSKKESCPQNHYRPGKAIETTSPIQKESALCG